MKFIAFFVALFILLFLLDKILIKLFGIKKKKIADTPGKKIDFWGRIIILIIVLVPLWYVFSLDSDFILKLYFMFQFTLIFGFQAITQFIYMKETKQHITTIFYLIMILVLFYNIEELKILL